jgi:hypothetical protein
MGCAEGKQVAAEKKRKKTNRKKREDGKSECSSAGGERREKLCFLTATSIRDWGFVCGPILMKF